MKSNGVMQLFLLFSQLSRYNFEILEFQIICQIAQFLLDISSQLLFVTQFDITSIFNGSTQFQFDVIFIVCQFFKSQIYVQEVEFVINFLIHLGSCVSLKSITSKFVNNSIVAGILLIGTHLA